MYPSMLQVDIYCYGLKRDFPAKKLGWDWFVDKDCLRRKDRCESDYSLAMIIHDVMEVQEDWMPGGTRFLQHRIAPGGME